ncbi:C factor cell-cell signaling protein [Vibrio sp. qd031]|uniref:SDR family oxidoreductase n=1 Tax=Vibrio sp. qd031 TaxID=1603038 RepID=UPI000A1163AF|nr:SDR family oxidoreductase [Vibrio sp. qd031]ORT51146.1 C factor cell-cell signaling protein [Vibrio sp. qd031]
MIVLIIGGTSGIGHALLEQIHNQYPTANIHATYHQNIPTLHAHQRINWHQVDATNESDIKGLSKKFDQADWVINCVGMLHQHHQGPEKSLSDFEPDFFARSLAINALPTMLLAKHFTPLLKKSANPRLVTLSAKVGSISDNHLGGWYSYRASKAALNMVIKTIAIEWQRSVKQGCVLALHPGTTDTPLSKPFQKNVPPDKLFTPKYVAQQLLGIIEGSLPVHSGTFYSYSGEQIPW